MKLASDLRKHKKVHRHSFSQTLVDLHTWIAKTLPYKMVSSLSTLKIERFNILKVLG